MSFFFYDLQPTQRRLLNKTYLATLIKANGLPAHRHSLTVFGSRFDNLMSYAHTRSSNIIQYLVVSSGSTIAVVSTKKTFYLLQVYRLLRGFPFLVGMTKFKGPIRKVSFSSSGQQLLVDSQGDTGVPIHLYELQY